MTTEPLIDLHTHSTCSDGTDSPTALITHAAKVGLRVVAVTDHDTTAGWGEASEAAESHGITVIRGVELSTVNQGVSQHLLGYGFDPTSPEMAAMLDEGIASRARRLEDQLRKLADNNMPITEADVLRHASAGGPIGKPAIADALVELEYVTSFNIGMALLNKGGVAYVSREKVDIEAAIRAIASAGGVSVIAHPRGRGSQVNEMRIAELKAVGLNGVEAAHLEHSPSDQEELRSIAANLGLVWTGSSDYHGTRKPNQLGCHTTPVAQYEQLLRQTVR